MTSVAQLVGAIVAAYVKCHADEISSLIVSFAPICRALLDALTPGGLSVSCKLGFGTTIAQVSSPIGGAERSFDLEGLLGTLYRDVCNSRSGTLGSDACSRK